MLCQASAGERKPLLLEAVSAYQEALSVFRRHGEHAGRFALAHMNLAVAYLAMPGDGDAATVPSVGEAPGGCGGSRTPTDASGGDVRSVIA